MSIQSNNTSIDAIAKNQDIGLMNNQRSFVLTSFFKKMERKLEQLSEFNSQLLRFEFCFPDYLQAFISVDILTLLMFTHFPENKSLEKMLREHFASISLFLERNDENSFVSLQCLTHSIVCLIKDYIEMLIKESLQPRQIFIVLTLIELFQKVQNLPLSLIIEIVNNVHSKISCITDEKRLPRFYSLLCSNVAPFLPQYSHKEFTLVLDLDETLGHYHQGKFLKRPWVNEFLIEMDKYYELVLFTASGREYADWAMDSIDPTGLVMLRLYREHTLENEIKNLEQLGRDLNKTIIIDNFSKSFQRQPENGIEIKSWLGDENDRELLKLRMPLSQLPLVRNKKLQELVAIINAKMKQKV